MMGGGTVLDSRPRYVKEAVPPVSQASQGRSALDSHSKRGTLRRDLPSAEAPWVSSTELCDGRTLRPCQVLNQVRGDASTHTAGEGRWQIDTRRERPHLSLVTHFHRGKRKKASKSVPTRGRQRRREREREREVNQALFRGGSPSRTGDSDAVEPVKDGGFAGGSQLTILSGLRQARVRACVISAAMGCAHGLQSAAGGSHGERGSLCLPG
jgi:hypothetical protein